MCSGLNANKEYYHFSRIGNPLYDSICSKWASLLDLSIGHFQIKMDFYNKKKIKTVLRSTNGLFQFNMIVMCLRNGIATFHETYFNRRTYVLDKYRWQRDVLNRINVEGLKAVSTKKFHLRIWSRFSNTLFQMRANKTEAVNSLPSRKTFAEVRLFLEYAYITADII